MEEQQEVGEPHGGTEVIEDMAEAVAKLLAQWKTGHFPSIDVNQVMLSDNMTPLSTWAVLYESMNHKGKILYQLDNIKKYISLRSFLRIRDQPESTPESPESKY